MTALAGFISTSPHGEAVVKGMLQRMHCPEGRMDILRSGHVVLGCLHPEGTLSGIAQGPRMAALFRGDVLNVPEVRSLAPDFPFRLHSPAESVMAAFAAHGIQSMHSHNGPCSLIFHNERQGESHIIRDRYGELTLHYTVGPGYLAFASEIKALLELVTPRFNKEALSYKAYEFCVGKETLFRDIWSLEPGDALLVHDDGRYSVHSWWRIWEHPQDVPDSPEKATELVVDLLEDALRLRRRDGACACMLSGGIDSSLVACMTVPDILYHAHYNFADFDELEYARCVAAHLSRELHIITPQKEDFVAQSEAILHTLDTPCTWTSFTLWMMLMRAHADGVDLLLTGDGADELFGGYHRYHLLYHDEQLRQMDAMKQYTYLIDKYYGSRVERYAKLVNRYENAYDAQVNGYLSQTLSHYENVSEGDVVNFMTLADFYTTSQVLFHMSDRIFSHFNVRSRSPFMDYRMVQMAFSMGTRFKIHEGVTKWILRKAAQRYLPPQVLARKDKRGFSAPVNRWFQWDTPGRYSRSGYRNSVLAQWQRIFTVAD